MNLILVFHPVTKYDIYARAVDDLKRKSPEIAEKILNGKLRVSHENIIELSRLPIEDINGLKRLLDSGSIDRIGTPNSGTNSGGRGFPPENRTQEG